MSESLDIEKIIKAGMLVRTKQQHSSDWVITGVINVHGNFIEIEHVEGYLYSVLMIGDILDCQMIDDKNINIMTAEVYNVKFASRSVILKIETIDIIDNKREYKRYDIYLSGSFCKIDNVYENYCVVLNVSLGGFSIATRCKLEKNDIIELAMYNKTSHIIMANCIVKWADKKESNYYYGLSISNMDERSKNLYRRFIRNLGRKEIQLCKKYKSQHDIMDINCQ